MTDRGCSHKGQKAWNEGLVHTEDSIEKMRNSTKKYWHNKKQTT